MKACVYTSDVHVLFERGERLPGDTGSDQRNSVIDFEKGSMIKKVGVIDHIRAASCLWSDPVGARLLRAEAAAKAVRTL